MSILSEKLKSKASFLHRNILALIASWMFIDFASNISYYFESIYLRELGASPLLIGVFGSISMAVLSLVQIPGGYIADKYGRKELIVKMTYILALSNLYSSRF